MLTLFVLPMFAACENLWDEHCIYTGYLEGHIELSDSTLKQTDFRLAYYPLSGQGIGVLDGQWDEYDEKGKAGRLVNIGDYRVLSYCPGDFEIRDTASFTSVTLVGKHGWYAASGLELITTNSRPAASDWGRGNVDIDDTTKVWMKPELLTQHLRINVHLLKVPDGSDFHPTESILRGVASEKRLYDHALTGAFYSLHSYFRKVTDTQYSLDADVLGTAGAPSHLFHLTCVAGGETFSYSFDLQDELEDWKTPYREIDLSLKVGDSMDTVEICLMGWIDRDQGDFSLLNQ